MNDFLNFLQAHWILAVLFIIAFFWLIIEESRHQGIGGARQSPQGVTTLINQHDAVVVDLREVSAYRDGHITQSINIPFANLLKGMNKIEKHKNQAIILVCAMGQQSVTAMHKLKKQGFAQLYVLGGGLAAWKKAGLPLVK